MEEEVISLLCGSITFDLYHLSSTAEYGCFTYAVIKISFKYQLK